MFGDLENFDARLLDFVVFGVLGVLQFVFVVFGVLGVLQFVFVVFVVSTATPMLGIPASGDFTVLTAGLIAAATILNGGMPKDT